LKKKNETYFNVGGGRGPLWARGGEAAGRNSGRKRPAPVMITGGGGVGNFWEEGTPFQGKKSLLILRGIRITKVGEKKKTTIYEGGGGENMPEAGGEIDECPLPNAVRKRPMVLNRPRGETWSG